MENKIEILDKELNFMFNGLQNLRYQVVNSEKLGINNEELALIKAQISSMETGCNIIKARKCLINNKKY